MPDMPLVSVVTCSYNNADYILETLDSIKNQTYRNIELVIVDDCSTDNSVSIIEDWLTRYTGKYKFIKHNINKGGSIPYNVGLQNATGKYYNTVDSDDALMPEKIERQVALLEAAGKNIAAVYSDSYVMDVESVLSDGLFIQRHRQLDKMPTGNIYSILLQGNFIPIMSLLIRRQVFDELGGYDESLVYGDFDMWLRIAARYEFLYSEYISGKYRIRPGSLSFTTRNWDFSNATIFLKHANAPLPLDWINKIAAHSYSTYNDATMPLIKELAIVTSDRLLMTTYLLWYFGITPSLGKQVQECVSTHIQKGLSPYILQTEETELAVFMHEVAHSVPLILLRKIAFDTLEREQEKTLPLINKLADKRKDRYLKTAYLLTKFKADKEVGKQMLKTLADLETDNERNNLIISFEGEHDVLWDTIMPIASYRMLQDIAINEYETTNEQNLLLLNEIAETKKDRFLKSAYLLWKFRVDPAVGGHALRDMQVKIENGLAEKFNGSFDSDVYFFINEVAPYIAPGLMMKIVCEEVKGSKKDDITFVHEFVKDKNDTCLTAACLLWKFRIPSVTITDILTSIENALANGQSLRLDIDTITNAYVLLKKLKPFLSTDLLKKLACEAYCDDNTGMISFVKELAKSNKSRYYKAILRLWKYRVNAFTGKIILQRVNEYCEDRRNWLYIDLCIYKDIYGAYKTKNAMQLNMFS